MYQTQHYRNIHRKVCQRLWSDLSVLTREAIASDVSHTSETSKWFQNKVANDAQRLYEDPAYYENTVQPVMQHGRVAVLWGNRFDLDYA
jgi:hypothetical protein